MKFDFKALLKLDASYGKPLVTVLYYIVAVLIALNVFLQFGYGISSIVAGAVFAGTVKILLCVPLAVVYLLVLRVVCELVVAAFDHFEK